VPEAVDATGAADPNRAFAILEHNLALAAEAVTQLELLDASGGCVGVVTSDGRVIAYAEHAILARHEPHAIVAVDEDAVRDAADGD